ncbi:hypothetical protein [Streptomyces violascens]|uniref:hypothetical protein n=1 Tax=Streptomyces violascens TaxID=67381 RepID=UPI00365FE6D7
MTEGAAVCTTAIADITTIAAAAHGTGRRHRIRSSSAGLTRRPPASAWMSCVPGARTAAAQP